jgi:hypothetical protein
VERRGRGQRAGDGSGGAGEPQEAGHC